LQNLSLLQGSFAKETYNFKALTHRSHHILNTSRLPHSYTSPTVTEDLTVISQLLFTSQLYLTVTEYLTLPHGYTSQLLNTSHSKSFPSNRPLLQKSPAKLGLFSSMSQNRYGEVAEYLTLKVFSEQRVFLVWTHPIIAQRFLNWYLRAVYILVLAPYI